MPSSALDRIFAEFLDLPASILARRSEAVRGLEDAVARHARLTKEAQARRPERPALPDDWTPTPDIFERLAKDEGYRRFVRNNDHVIFKAHLAMALWESAALLKVLRNENGKLSPLQLGQKMDPVLDADAVNQLLRWWAEVRRRAVQE